MHIEQKEGKLYMRSGNGYLRCGLTTGSCAALAASGAAMLLLGEKKPETLRLVTPKGIPVQVRPEELRMEGENAFCSVRKDAGDDPDVTDGMLVAAFVCRTECGLEICGGEGVGTVTKPGLDQPVGEAAINSVPRRMIREALETVCEELGYPGGLRVTIAIPEGEKIAARTFNPALGIEGGLSVLGTSGIVEPMSEQALLDTIALEIRQKACEGDGRLILTPGNYGSDYLDSREGSLSAVPRVRCSNYIGDAIDMATAEGLREVLLVGHVGKLVKLAAGIMQTHSRVADGRREIFCAHAARSGAGKEICTRIMDQVTTDGCLEILEEAGLREPVMAGILSAAQEHLDRRAGERVAIGALMFSNQYGTLGMTATARELVERWERQN